MWYSWNEAKQMSNEVSERSKESRGSPKAILAPYGSLLDPIGSADSANLDQPQPSPTVIFALWGRYLKNVHPLVKIFFDWEKEPLIQKAANAPTTLSHEEAAFTFALYFITILSLSEEDVKLIFSDSSKSQLMNDFQSSTESALLATGFIATSKLIVLQAFMLYLVMSFKQIVRAAH
jgi:hypothetical protein